MYRKATSLPLRGMCPSALKVFRVESLGSFMYRIMSSSNMGTLTSSFPVCVPFLSFPCFIVLAKTSSIVLNRSGKSGHSCLFLGLSRNVSRFFPFNTMLAVVYPTRSLLC